MKKIVTLISILVLLFSSYSSFAQGGDNCAAAFASPITLPFTANGSTCTATDNYFLIGAPCINDGYLQGPDWLYYFCATSTGQVQIVLNNFNPAAPFASVSLWSGCPNAGNCVGASVTQTGTAVALTANVINGNCYYIMVDNWPTPNCYDYTISVSMIPPPGPPNPQCTNSDFEAGNFAGWTGTDGLTSDGLVAAQYPTYNQVSTGLPSAQTTITSGVGNDPCAPFPVVCPGGSFSARLGDGPVAGYGGATLQQKFIVNAATSNFTYNYAAVIMDAGHVAYQQPFFLVDMYDQNGNIITCAHYLVVGGANIPGFFPGGCFVGTYYRPWTSVNIDLSAFIGQPVTIKFTVGDCSQGAHFSYAYIDCSCLQLAILGNDSICTGQSTTLTAPSGSGSYLWSPGNMTSQSVTVSPTNQPYQIYTCTLTSISNPSCNTTLKDTVWVFPLPTASFTALPSGQCNGGSCSVTNSSSGGTTYSWAWGDNTNSTLQNPPVHNYSPAGNYTITLYVTNSHGCQDTMQVPITVGGPSTVSNFSNTTVCLNNPTVFTDLSTGGATNWAWNFGEPSSGPNNISANQNPSHTYSASGTYTVTLITNAGNPACGDTISIVVTVNPLPTPIFVNTSVCVGQPTQFTDQSTIQTGNITGWNWNFGDPTSGPNNISTLQNPTHTFTGAGTYTVILTTTSNNGCQNSISVVVTVNPLPVSLFTATTVCQNNPTVFTNNSTGGTAWAWNFGDNTTSTLQNPTHVYSTSGTFNAVLVVTNSFGCSATSTIVVTVNPGPTSQFIATSVCLGSATTFTDQSTIQTGNITAWAWDFGDNTTSTLQNPTHVYANAGNYTVTLTTTSSTGCTHTITVQVTVYPLPVAAFSNTSVCFGSPTVFTDQSTVSMGTITNWSWTFGDNTNSTLQNPSHTYLTTGTFNVTLFVTSSFGCTDSISQQINVFPNPIAAFTADDTDGCVIHCVNFTDLSSVTTGNISGWSWNFGDGATSNLQNPQHCYTVPGTYDVSLTVTTSNGCTASFTNFTYIVVYALPVAEFSASPNPTSVLDPVIHFTDLSTGNPITWYWTFGDQPDDSIQNPTHTYPNENTGVHYYDVTLVITDQHGCTSTVTHTVEVDPEFTFYAPNCVTPNGDGANDFFFAYGVGWKDFKMWIFDRWGMLIWQTENMNKGWDARVQDGASGDIVQEDVYVWKVRITDVFDKKHDYIGHVSVIK